MEPNIGLTSQQQAGVVKILAALLADEYVLYTKTRNYHWNVRGLQFFEFHTFFESQYEELDGIIDEVAERIRALGSPAPGALADFARLTRLKEPREQILEAKGMISHLLSDHERMIRHLRTDLTQAGEEYQDAGTNDFLTGLMEKHEHMAWMLRAHIEA